MSFEKAVAAIHKHHILLVYPIKNTSEPASLWTCLHPRTPMRWDWSEDADPKVVKMWHLKNELSETTDVVYAKWFRDRATFFSKDMCAAIMCLLGTCEIEDIYVDANAAALYEALCDNSPQTPKSLRESADLTGSFNRAPFEKAMKYLWRHLLITGTGEVDEGQFPALAVGAMRHIHEDVWDKACAMDKVEAQAFVNRHLPVGSALRKYLDRIRSQKSRY